MEAIGDFILILSVIFTVSLTSDLDRCQTDATKKKDSSQTDEKKNTNRRQTVIKKSE